MKKKLKDLTFFDVNEACLKHKCCAECPLNINHGIDGGLCIVLFVTVKSFQKEWEKLGEQEVEI